MRKVLIAALLLVTAVAVADAGDSKKCDTPTQECLNMMTQYWKEHGWVGVELDQADAEKGMVLTRVVANSPAEAAGLRVGDVLHAMNGIEINEDNDEKIQADKKSWRIGATVEWTMIRDGQKVQHDIVLAEMPADVLAAWIGQHMLTHAQVEIAAAE